ncbi:MAG: DUF2779 domain-containing protein [Acholeplasmatales bacterium]|nr:DUF2779 domain-containing protein [Acholeplasmatales bacterium]
MSILISKSKYVSFIECPKRLWLSLFKPEVEEKSEASIKRLEAGTKCGDLAMPIFGDYIDVTTYDGDHLNLKKMAMLTNEEIAKGTENICEASFFVDDLYCAVDILHKGNDGWEIYEVKSTSHVEDYHYIDSSFQYYVLKKAGLNITSVNIITLDNTYIRQDELNIKKLFKIHDVTEHANKLIDDIPANLERLRAFITATNEPNIDISKACDKPFECSFKKYCYKHLPKPSVFDLSNCRKKLDFYNEGIITFEQLYSSKYFNKLTPTNKRQVLFEIEDRQMEINKDNVKNFLSQITYPLYLLDFETMQPAIPLFDKTKPYQQVTFQYSLHIIDENGKLTHKEFLAEEGKMPCRDLALSLINDIPNDKMIMAYNDTFEKTRIKELAIMYPDLEDELLKRANNFIDLMIPFKEQDIYKKEFEGSYSIKYILPGLFPNEPSLDYHNLNIVHNGSEAMSIYEKLLDYSKEERIEIRKALLEYCKLDTYAMVKILQKLYELIK